MLSGLDGMSFPCVVPTGVLVEFVSVIGDLLSSATAASCWTGVSGSATEVELDPLIVVLALECSVEDCPTCVCVSASSASMVSSSSMGSCP